MSFTFKILTGSNNIYANGTSARSESRATVALSNQVDFSSVKYQLRHGFSIYIYSISYLFRY